MGRGVDGNAQPIRLEKKSFDRKLNMNPSEAERLRSHFLQQVDQGIIQGVVEGEDLVPNPKTKHSPGDGRVLSLGPHRITRIVTGGQSGVDRGSLLFARKNGVSVGGWCPKGGWAEDMLDPPGVLSLFPEMQETRSARVEQRTQWNVRDSDATVIFLADENSSGSNLTADTAKALGLPYRVFSLQAKAEEVSSWLKSLEEVEVLNIAGPRESESPGASKKIEELLSRVFLKEANT